eukprot:Opistho-2@84306
MSGAVYGGDEVGALVFDIGSHVTRAGYAGEDVPKAVFSSTVGVGAEASREGASDAVPMDVDGAPQTVPASTVGKKYYVGTAAGPSFTRHALEMKGVMEDGLVADWDIYEALVDHAYSSCLRADPSQHPLLISEPSWTTRAVRERMVEIAFERHKVPALFLAKIAVLTAFSMGRYAGLVVDSGASQTSVVPVYDGFMLHKGIRRSELGGDFLASQHRLVLENELGIPVVPGYQIQSRETVAEGDPPQFTLRTLTPTQSFHNYAVRTLLEDFHASVSQVSETAYDEGLLANLPTKSYEFPNGYNAGFGAERFRVPEIMFNPDAYIVKDASDKGKGAEAARPSHPGLGRLVADSVAACDVDIRPTLHGCVIATGGNTLVPGFVERLQAEVYAVAPPGSKVKVVAPPSASERRFSAWIGGSILASLSTFQQMWISRQEYEESGKSIVEKRCP